MRSAAPTTMCGHVFFILLFLDLELLQFIPQHPFADAELFRSPGLDPSGGLERLYDDAAFQGVERVGQRSVALRDTDLLLALDELKMERDIPRCDDLAFGKNDGAFDDAASGTS